MGPGLGNQTGTRNFGLHRFCGARNAEVPTTQVLMTAFPPTVFVGRAQKGQCYIASEYGYGEHEGVRPSASYFSHYTVQQCSIGDEDNNFGLRNHHTSLSPMPDEFCRNKDVRSFYEPA